MDRLVITNVTIFTGTGDLIPDGTVRIEDGRIAAVGRDAAAPKDAERLDGEGMFLLPGFIDAHCHLTLVHVPERPEMHPDAPFMAVRNAAEKLASGVTTVRDVGGFLHTDLALKRAIRAGRVAGPRMIASGMAICPTGGHIHYFAREADGPDEVRRAAREQFKAGADFLKIMVSGGIANVGEDPDRLQMERDEILAAVAIANEHRSPVAAHVYPARGIKLCAESGVTSVEHAPGLDDNAIDVLGDRGGWVIPTQCVYKHMADNPGNAMPAEKAEMAAKVFREKTPPLARAIKAGVKVGVGTDCGRHFPHADYVTELRHLCDAGMTAEQALLAGTRDNAALLGIGDKVGTVAVGKIADLVLVAGNPLDDLDNARAVRAIVQGGRVLRPEALLQRGRA